MTAAICNRSTLWQRKWKKKGRRKENKEKTEGVEEEGKTKKNRGIDSKMLALQL